MKIKISDILLKSGAAWLSMTILFLLAMWCVHLIPRETVEQNVNASMHELDRMPLDFNPDDSNFRKMIRSDKFTDMVILNLTRSADNNDALRASILNYQYIDTVNPYIVVNSRMDGYFNSPTAIKASYGRYWQGHQIPVRIAMSFTTYKWLTVFNVCLSLLLFIIMMVSVRKKYPPALFWCFLGAIIMTGFPLTTICLQFIPCITVMFIAVTLIARFPSLSSSLQNGIMLFFITGGIICFMDFLTFPIITLCYPLVFWLASSKRKPVRTGIILSLAWSAGYALIWGTKWLIIYFVDGTDGINAVFDRIHTWTGVITANDTTSFALVILLAAIISGMCLKEYFCTRKIHVLLIIAMEPILWFCILKNHAATHDWFTWRMIPASLFCIALYLIDQAELRKNKNSMPDRQAPQQMNNSLSNDKDTL